MTRLRFKTMCKYQELHNKHRTEMNAFPMAFAFTESQFDEVLVKLEATKEEIMSIGSGGFIRKSDEKSLMFIVNKHVAECEEAKKDPQYCFDMFLYELGNHEFCITGRVSDVLEACQITKEELYACPILLEALKEAKRYYISTCPDW